MTEKIRRYKQGPLTFVVESQVDECPDLSMLGEYTDRWAPGAIDRKKNGDAGRNEYRFFVSAYDVDEAQKWLHKHGWCKHDAWLLPRQQARLDYERAEDYNRGGWCMLILSVSLHINCKEITKEYLGGVASDCGDETLDADIHELIAECKAHFMSAIAELPLEEL